MDQKAPVGLRNLPSVDRVLNAAAELVTRFGRAPTLDAIRSELDHARQKLSAGESAAPTIDMLVAQIAEKLDHGNRAPLRPLFNLTGTVLHTNLGRALLADTAIAAATAAMSEAVALEFDLATGKRGERDDHVRELLCALTGAEDATIVNNNAAAVLLVLNTLAQGRDAIVSRGELIEIGGAFRMPDIMACAGAKLVEVGTTNRTHAKDYRGATGTDTGVILKVHTSNYRIQGFTAEVPAAELLTIARDANVPLVNDLGSGTLVDLAHYGLAKEPTVREAVAEADLVTFSGDKLLGGPQAGFIVGRRDLIARINRNPMKRALRVDKIRLAAIAATLALYRDPDRLAERLPTLKFLARSYEDIRRLAEGLRSELADILGGTITVEIIECVSQIGSGASPLDTLPSAGLALCAGSGSALNDLAERMRGLSRPVIGRMEGGALVLDLRCLTDAPGFLAAMGELRFQ